MKTAPSAKDYHQPSFKPKRVKPYQVAAAWRSYQPALSDSAENQGSTAAALFPLARMGFEELK